MNIDLDAYFDRIAYRGNASPGVGLLEELHFLHPVAIPFENLSTLIREPVPLDLESLQRKLISSGRGGYCFEQNRLFANVLESMGFPVTALAARVVWNRSPGTASPRTHMVLLVEVGTDQYIADVGFGGITLTSPLRFETGTEQQTAHETYRLMEAGSEYELEVCLGERWRPMYRFDLQPQQPIDFEVSNHYVSTHPDSHFLTTLMAARPTKTGRYALQNNRLLTYRGQAVEERQVLESVEVLKSALTDLFGIELPTSPALEPALHAIVAVGG